VVDRLLKDMGYEQPGSLPSEIVDWQSAEELHSRVKESLSILSDDERRVICLRFGLYDNPLTVAQIAARLQMTEQDVECFEGSALEKLRRFAPST